MTTTIHKKFEVAEPINKVWAYLTDPEKIVVCVPGASLKEKIDERNFKGGVTLKFGPVKASYNGQIGFEELDKANHNMTLKGRGLDAKGKGSADMLMKSHLTETANGTEVDCSMEISIVGKLAQFGARLINDVSDELFNQFVNNFKATLAADSTPIVAETTTADAAVVSSSTADKVEALNQSAAEVEKAVADVKKAQAAINPPMSKDVNTGSKLIADAKITKGKVSKVNTSKPTEKDNSLNAFSLILALIKGWFSRLFGGKK